jgi:hypothetical protein
MDSKGVRRVKTYDEACDELMVLIQSMAAVSGGALTCSGKTRDGLSLLCNGEEIGDKLSVYRGYLALFENPVEMANCFYHDILLSVKKAGIAQSYKVGEKFFESLLARLWGDSAVAREHLRVLVEKYG